MDFTSTPSYRAMKRLFRFTACFLSISAVATVQAQTTDLDTTQTSQQPSTYNGPNPYSMPATTLPTSSARPLETDISSPRLQNHPLNEGRPAREQTISPLLLPPAPPSEFQKMVFQTTGRNLPIFGANLFNVSPSTFAPVDNIPVTPDYLIGPGDEIRLQVWGQVNQRGSFVVDRTGSISIPEVGTVHVAGLQYSQLSGFLKSQFARVYRNFDLNVNLGQLRSIQVFVVGRARQPGSYTIGSLSTLLNAVFASGGPLPQGSLRDIQVKRGGETVTHFDLYDLLLHGDKSKDIRLLPGDVIFIPEAGPQVAVLGSVNTPAIYELRDEKSFNQVIALAGGLTSAASGTPVRVERIDKGAQRSMIDVDLSSPTSPTVQDGDIINVTSILDRFQNAVTLRGNVANPGRYVWHQGMRISDLIPNKEALVTRSYYQKLAELGQSNPEFPGPLPGSATESATRAYSPYSTSTQYIQPSLFQYNQPNPSSSQYNQPSTGQPNPAALQPIQRSDEDGTYTPALPVEGLLQTQSGAQTNAIHQAPSTGAGGSSIGAAVASTSATFSPRNDVVLSAPDIDWQYAVIERQKTSDLTTTLVPFNLAKAVLDKNPSQDLQLLPGDVVTIFSKADIRVPSEQQTKFVRLEGEFQAAGVYSVAPGETLRQLLTRVGGLTPQADLFASEFTRESVRRIQKQRLLEYADQLETQISATTSATVAGSLNERDVAAAQASATSARQVLARLRQAEPSGRIVLQLKPDSQGINALPDIQLQDGDRFIVPRVPSTVSVEGQVYNANAFLYEKGNRVKDYLRLAGGPDRIGDRKREFILRADGSVVSRQYSSNVSQRALFANRNFDDTLLYPGDTIIVPPVIQKTAFLRELSNISTIFEGFGLGAAAINVLGL